MPIGKPHKLQDFTRKIQTRNKRMIEGANSRGIMLLTDFRDAHGDCPLLADEPARRRKSAGGAVPIAAGCRHLYAILRSESRFRNNSAASRSGIFPTAAAPGVSIDASLHADGARELRFARVRFDREQRIGP